MKMKMISFKNGMHITVPDDDGRAVVFATGLDNKMSTALNGPLEEVMDLIVALAHIAVCNCKNPDMKSAFVLGMLTALFTDSDEKKDH